MNATRWTTTQTLIIYFALEATYVAGARVLIHYADPNRVTTELVWTVLRLASAITLWVIFKPILEKPRPWLKTLSAWWLLPVLAFLCCVLVPLLSGDWQLNGTHTRIVFAITSLAVGLREELSYRAILQTVLEKKLGLSGAIAVTTIAFSVYHYGAQPWTAFTVSQYIAFGVILGLLYARTRSLWLVVAIHAIYDALYCFTPYGANPWEPQRTIPFLAAATLLTLTWFIFSRKKGAA